MCVEGAGRAWNADPSAPSGGLDVDRRRESNKRRLFVMVTALAALVSSTAWAQQKVAVADVGGLPTALVSNPANNQIYVGDPTGSRIRVIDGVSMRVVDDIPVPVVGEMDVDPERGVLWVSGLNREIGRASCRERV